MRTVPEIAALRSDPGIQRRAQAATGAAGEAWRNGEAAQVLADLERYGRGAPLGACAALERAVTSADAGSALASALCRRLAAAVGCEPFGHPALRHTCGPDSSSLLLARSGRARLILLAHEPGDRRTEQASFSDGERLEAVLAGNAAARLIRRGGPPGQALAAQTQALAPGACLSLDLAREAVQILTVERRLVRLRLERTPARPRPSEALAFPGGELLRRSCGDLRASRHEMMVAVLGAMGRHEAAPVLAEIACEPGDDSLRWQALRACLALDTAAGYRALMAVSSAPADPLAASAGALRARLVEAHPALLTLEGAPCPA